MRKAMTDVLDKHRALFGEWQTIETLPTCATCGRVCGLLLEGMACIERHPDGAVKYYCAQHASETWMEGSDGDADG